MNKRIKTKLVKKINRQLASKACQYFISGTPSCKRVFEYRLKQYTGIEAPSIDKYKTWI